MKKIFTIVMLAVATMSASAQVTKNLFDAADCDADGWLWLNTQEKIAKYVGTINEDDYTVDPNGKPIQMAFANITPDYPETVADPDVLGADEGGYVFGDEEFNAETALKGGIALAPASAQMSMNGGCLVLNLPSCATISLVLSSEAKMLGRTLMLSPNNGIDIDNTPAGGDPWTGDTKSIYAKASVFGQLHIAGQWKWEGIESLNNGYNTGVTFVSNEPVYFALQNCHKYTIYVHAIRVTLPQQDPTGISSVNTSNTVSEVFSLDGRRQAKATRGLNIIRQNGVTRKVIK